MNHDTTPTLTDAEARRALFSAGVPSGYHDKSRSLQTLQNCPHVKRAYAWIADAKLSASLNGSAEISFDGRHGMDFTYLLARAMLLSGIAVGCAPMVKLTDAVVNRFDPRTAEWQENMFGRDILIVTGALGTGPIPYPPEKMYEVEWQLRNWLLSGRSLILQGSVPSDKCAWWDHGFIDLFASYRTQCFEAPVTAPTSAPRRAAK